MYSDRPVGQQQPYWKMVVDVRCTKASQVGKLILQGGPLNYTIHSVCPSPELFSSVYTVNEYVYLLTLILYTDLQEYV